ncbi:hypothetical protein [Micromonospora endolithica]|uniref:Uncharacterized protein n=1 Tax=Micromonospora endolithica TaxID=230091 RepID=A0A3A9YXE8_9ACTN|nr:hypothetical protein [Micromonospora endolithica]RKN40314.1 hypothetical protein D7223_27355 [Micromonospora endolithica]TWJ22641.1 hypothetical protein JD76_02763 [Micromonospora endolithica]
MHRLAYVVVAAVLALAGSAPAAAHSPARPAAGQTADTGTELISVRGAGPFRIGARLDRLQAAGLIDWVASDGPDLVRTGVTGQWAGKLILTFRDGRLVGVGTATAPPRTPAGAQVGMFFADLERIYGPRGSMINNDAGADRAYLVRVGSRVELFTGHPIRQGVGYLEVGLASYVERAYRERCGC